jgi:hypothetical protein
MNTAGRGSSCTTPCAEPGETGAFMVRQKGGTQVGQRETHIGALRPRGTGPILDIGWNSLQARPFASVRFQPVRTDLESVSVSPSAAYFAWRNRIVTLITYFHERSHRPVMAFIGRKL